MAHAVDTVRADFADATNESFTDTLHRYTDGLFSWLSRNPSAIAHIAAGQIPPEAVD